MGTSSPARLRAFVRQHTRLVPVAGLPVAGLPVAGLPVAGVPDVRLYTGSDVMALCQLVGSELGQADPDLPYWAFPWAGGLAIAHHLIAHPEVVRGRTVLDLAAGSGLCGIVALRLGAVTVEANDIDPLAEAAVWLNARANGVNLGFRRRDILGEPPPEVDVILAGDVCYQEGMAARMLPWLHRAAHEGTRVLIGDPGRPYLPEGLERVGVYRVHTSRELEDAEQKPSAVYTFPR